MKKEFVLAFNEVLEDRQLPRDVVMEALEAAMVSAYRKAVNASNAQHITAKVDSETGNVSIEAEKEVVETVNDPRTEVTLQEARTVDPETEVGQIVIVESTPKNFGRVAAQTARQVIQQRIREAERDVQHAYFSNIEDEIVSGVVQAISSQGITLGLDKRAEGLMPRSQQIPGERFRVHDRVRALLLEVRQTPRGPQIILSRSHRNFLRRLLEDEVPEIYQGLVEVRSIAREPGHRSKVAVAALQAGIDPVGACVGLRGVRIQAIVRELNDEKIDVIEWNPDPAMYIAKALSPARVNGVYLDSFTRGNKTATVVVPEDQLSLAIGRDGQNARLAAKLTGWRIDIKSLPEAAGDALYKIQNDPDYAEEAEKETEAVPQVEMILAKKAEGRPVTPEEYKVLGGFVDRVEHSYMHRLQEEVQAERARLEEIRAQIPEPAFEMSLEDLELSTRWVNLLDGAGYPNVGELMYQMEIDPDTILALNGVGPKAMEEIEASLTDATIPSEVEAEAEAEAEPVTDEVLAEEVAAEEALEAEAPEEAEAPAAPVDAEAPGEEVEETAPEGDAEEEDEEEESLDEIFTLDDDEIPVSDEFVKDERLEKLEEKKKKKSKRRKYVQMEYDPEEDVMIVRRKRKRDEGEWEEGWEEW